MTRQEILDWINTELKSPPEFAYRHLARCPNWRGYEIYSPYELASEVGEDGGSWPVMVMIKGSSIRIMRSDEEDAYFDYFARYYPDWPD